MIILLTVAFGITLALLSQKRSYQRAVYRDRHASEWATDFYPNFNPHGTNEAVHAFQVLGSNAVPALRSLLHSHAPFYENALLKNARWLPLGIRRYLFDKFKPGQVLGRRISAVRALSIIGPAAPEVVPDLIAALTDPAGGLRSAAAKALGGMGDPAILALAAAATNENVILRQTAVYALGEAGTNAAAAAVIFDCLLDTNESIRVSALYALSRIGPAGVPVVLSAFSSDDPGRRATAAQAIQAMNRPPWPVTRILRESATNASPTVRWQSLKALQALRLNQPYVVAMYWQALNDQDPDVRGAAAQAISQPAGWTTNPALSEFIAVSLGLSGSLDSNIAAKLNDMRSDPEPSVRIAVQRALNEIQPGPPN